MTKEKAFAELLELEKMNGDMREQINHIMNLLNEEEGKGILKKGKVLSHMERSYNHPTENYIYYRECIEGTEPEVDENFIDAERLAVIYIIKNNNRSEDVFSYTMIDKTFYLQTAKVEELCFKNNDRGYIEVTKKKHCHLHQMVLSVEEGEEVDHISCNKKVNIRKLLRKCTKEQNTYNKRKVHYAKTCRMANSFYAYANGMSEEIKGKYRKKGYYFEEFSIVSPKYESEREMYKEMKEFEVERIGKFRYDPYLDFSETWYVLIFWKVLGVINYEGVKKYQQEYFGREYIKAKETGDANREMELKELLRRDMYDYYETII